MNQTILPGRLSGAIGAIPSKSMAHRLLICAALAGDPAAVRCDASSADLTATRACLQALAAGSPEMPCGESGSTLRFLLPVAAALGRTAEFVLEGRLPQRPMAALEQQLEEHGVTLTRPEPHRLCCCGQLRPGVYTLPGNVSSQFISGLLLALPLLDGPSTLTVTGQMESAPYVQMTISALSRFGITIQQAGQTFQIPAGQYQSPGPVDVEGDWSNAAFWLCAGALGSPVTVTGLNRDSLQGDRVVLDLLERFGADVQWNGDAVTVSPGPLRPVEIDAAAIPDLIPPLSVVGAAAPGITRIFHAGRLRLKESDRLDSICKLLTALGGLVEQTTDGLLIHGGRALSGGVADSCGDHRIAMSAAIAATLCSSPVTVAGAEAVNKSYPDFWRDLARLSD